MSKSPVEITGEESISTSHAEIYQSKDSRFRNNEKIRRVAAVDIGTNSIHLVIASVDPVLNTFSIDLAEKSSTRLGNRDVDLFVKGEVAKKSQPIESKNPPNP